jgi:hypothetical protein
LGENSQIALEAAATATTADIRWFWEIGALKGLEMSVSVDAIKSSQSATISAVAVEAEVTIPSGAVGFVIESVAAGGASNGLLYRVDNGTANGEQIPLLQGDDISTVHPYTIWLSDEDRLRVERITGDATVLGYWLMRS